MRLSTDHSFHIGEQHLRQGKPCQDYALSGLLSDTTAYAIVSDGCSSGGMTDFGARLITVANRRAIEEYPLLPSDNTRLIATRDAYLESFRAALHLEHQDLFATSLYAIANEKIAAVNVTGDGVVALQYENGLLIHEYAWQNNMPYYPAYRVARLDDSFVTTHGIDTPLQEAVTFLATDTDQPEVKEFNHPVEIGMSGVEHSFSIVDETLGNLQLLALLSDGVEQVDHVSTTEVVQALLAFKSTGGQFAVRRMNRFLQEARKLGRGPLDDIAYSVIHFNHVSEVQDGQN